MEQPRWRGRSGSVLRAVYALCLLGATYNHWAIIVRHELLWDYDGLPVMSAIFWTSLAFLDPAAVLLLWRRPRAGVAATMAIIVVDVVHNLWRLLKKSLRLRRGVGQSNILIGLRLLSQYIVQKWLPTSCHITREVVALRGCQVFQQSLWVLARFSPPLLRTLLETPGVIAQIVFMLFVLATAPITARSR